MATDYFRIGILLVACVLVAVFFTRSGQCPVKIVEKVEIRDDCDANGRAPASRSAAPLADAGDDTAERQEQCPPCDKPDPCPAPKKSKKKRSSSLFSFKKSDGADGDANNNWKSAVNRHPLKAVPTYRVRADLPALIQKEGPAFKRGIELGVKMGEFAEQMLAGWKNCEEYWLVDLWKHQQNYHDVANVGDHQQNAHMKIAMQKTARYPFVKTCRNFTSECAKLFPDEYFDWVFVDARHDRKGVEEDLQTWWPKVKYGGLFMGHDYVEQFEIGAQRWDVNYDGTIDKTGKILRGAVDEFFMSGTPETNEHYRQVVVSHRELFSCWGVRK